MNANTPTPTDQQGLNQMLAIADVRRRVKAGASNFYWIAGLSLVNTAIFFFGGTISFVVGLGITQFVDGVAYVMANELPDLALVVRGFGILIDLCIAGLFVLFGVFAARGQRWAFIVGLVLYGLDALLMLVFKVWLGLGFHVLFLVLLFGGLQSLNRLQRMVPQTVSDPAFPKNIGSGF